MKDVDFDCSLVLSGWWEFVEVFFLLGKAFQFCVCFIG